ncbi:MAG: MFS transporter [Steroidobacteraceae bacterium]|jgi:GPH family glycoside/pentoside/hexuronide:cation symporter|nr:MFS transporter [Steroidobacteraceae bacterium]
MAAAAGIAPAGPAAAAATAAPGRTLPTWVYAGWGFGTLAPALVLSLTNILLLRFMTDHVGLSAAVGASLIAFSKIYDAVTDPLGGLLSDKTRSRWGRRRPWLLAGTLMLVVAMLALFWGPSLQSPAAAAWYMGAALIFYATAYSAFSIPYMAMPAEMTQGYHDRSYLMSFRVYAVGLAGLAASAGGPALIAAYGGGLQGHRLMALTLAPLVLAAGLVCFFATARAPFVPAPPAQRVPLAEQVRLALANRPFVILLVIKFFTLMNLGTAAATPFFFQRILGLSDGFLGLYLLTSSVSLMASQPLWLAVSRRLGKKRAYQIALAIPVVVGVSWFLAAQGDPLATILLRGAFSGVGAGGVLLMGQSLLPDTMEYDYRRTGLRREGVFSGLYTTMEKAASAMGVSVVGAFLSAMGYVQSRGGVVVEQPPSAILAITICIAVIPASMNLLSAFALLFYDLDEEKLKRTTRVA